MELTLARSLAGHDKDDVYVIVGEDGDLALLANGDNRTMASPKRKKHKHLQPIKHLPPEVTAEAEGGLSDLKIKRILKLYRISQSKE